MTSISIRDLKLRPQWVCWKYYDVDGRRAKVPKNPHCGQCARIDDPTTWGTYEDCLKAQAICKYEGIGIVFANGVCGIDIDAINHNTDQETVNPLAKELCEQFKGTYIEKSPSGKGYHILGVCDTDKLPFIENDGNEITLAKDFYSKNPNNNVEIYFSNRFFTFTDESITNDILEDITNPIMDFMVNNMRRKDTTTNMTELNSIIENAQSAKDGQTFIDLFYNGDISHYNNDQSRADLALCSILAYWSNGDKEKVDTLFRKSKLYRDKWEREDYRANTIDLAVNSALNMNTSKSSTKAVLTLPILERWLIENGISIKTNEITHELELAGFPSKYNPQSLPEQMHIILYEMLKSDYKCSTSQILGLLSVIAQCNTYNPVIEMLANAEPWDGKDRLEELYNIIHIDSNDTLSKTLLHKWLLMSLALAQNRFEDPFGADGILVFQGAQGIGKTSLCTKLGVCTSLVKTGLFVDVSDKDTIINATSCWIGELGELETTLRSDMARLKGFITADIDRYRAPYGKTTLTYPRHTAFIATCNSEQFLADETGSRRFWLIPCRQKFDLSRLTKLDSLQLWKQIEAELKTLPYSTEHFSPYQSCFRLNDEERKLLEKRNSTFNRKVKAQVEIEDILIEAEVNPLQYEWKWCTTSQFKAEYESLKRYSSENIGRALSALNIETKSMRLNGSSSVSKGCRKLPFRTTTLTGFTEQDVVGMEYGRPIADDEPF